MKKEVTEYLAMIGARGGKASKGKPRNVDPKLRSKRAKLSWAKRRGKVK